MTIRPLRFTELFDAIMSATFRDFRTLARVVLVVAVPLRLVEVAIFAATVSHAHDITSRSVLNSRATLGVNLTVALLSALIVVLATALSFKAASAAYAGTRVDWRSSIEFAGGRLGPVLWVAIIAAVGIIAGFVAFVLPGIWLLVAWSVAIPALLFERLGPVAALGRSFGLVQGRWWATFGILIVAALIARIASGIVMTGFDALMSTSVGDHVVSAAAVNALGETAAAVIGLPIQMVAVALVYYDLRAHKDPLPAGELARRLSIDAPAPPAAAQPGEADPGWRPPVPPRDATPPAEWAPPRPPGPEDLER